MQFGVKAWSRNSRARAGILHLPSSAMEVETPCLLLSTRKGLPHFLSPDLLASLPSPDSHLLQFSPLHFVEGLPRKTICNACEIRKMVGLHQYGFAAVPRDSIVCLPEASGANKLAASFETPCGRLSINPLEYMRMVNSMRPDWWVSLSDEVPLCVTEKRNKVSVDRTVKWLDECIMSRETDGAVFGAIVGGSSLEERKRCANEVVKRNVSGYWIGGLGLGDTIANHPSLLTAVTDLLPRGKPRQVCGLALPEEVLQGVAAGIDIFDSTYIYHLTLEGFALTFSMNDTQRIPCHELSETGSDSTKINLKATVYRRDVSPIVDGCSCYTCQNHTRAYINHLLNVREMLAHILLEIHNTHHYLGFFRRIREAIYEDKFEQFQLQYMMNRRNQLTSTAEMEANAKMEELAKSSSKSEFKIHKEVFDGLKYEEGKPRKPVGINSCMEIENLKSTISNMKEENQGALANMKEEIEELRAKVDQTKSDFDASSQCNACRFCV